MASLASDVSKDRPMKESPGLWEQGFSIFTDELAKEEHAQLSLIKRAMKKATDPEVKIQFKREIDNIKAEFKAKREHAKYSQFMKP